MACLKKTAQAQSIRCWVLGRTLRSDMLLTCAIFFFFRAGWPLGKNEHRPKQNKYKRTPEKTQK